MSGVTLPIYRLPIPTATEIGHVRLVLDRHKRAYVNGVPVESSVASGDFLILTLANNAVFYVKADEYKRAQQPQPKQRRAKRR